jgi:hypothetical protein
MLTGTNEEDIAPWRGIDVPRGFTGYVYNWCPNLGTRYTPMRTPGYIELQVQRLAAEPHPVALSRRSPASSSASKVPSITRWAACSTIRRTTTPAPRCPSSARPRSATQEHRLLHACLLRRALSRHRALLRPHRHAHATCGPIKPLPTDARGRKTVQDPFQLIAFLYTPNACSPRWRRHLAQSEKLATARRRSKHVSRSCAPSSIT